MPGYSIPNMTCGGCVRGVTHAIRALDDEAVVAADLPTKIVQVTSRADGPAIVAVLKAAGYEATPVE